jgi:dihydrofolate reductase
MKFSFANINSGTGAARDHDFFIGSIPDFDVNKLDNCCVQPGERNRRRRGMPRLSVFNHISIDGRFTDANGDMSFAHNEQQDAEWDAFVAGNATGGGVLLFGRVTYELMASFWPTPYAAQAMPQVAERMNNMPKVVFSRTLEKASWNNTKLVKNDMAREIRKMKKGSGEDMVILGSGSIVSQLAQERLIDEYQIVVNPVALGSGRTMFDGIKENLSLRLKSTRSFGNGNVLLCYEPVE